MNNTHPSPSIVHTFLRNTSGGGGESVAALRLGNALAAQGVDVSFWHPDAVEHPAGFGGGAPHYAKPNRWLYNWQKKRILGLYNNKLSKTPFSFPWHFNKTPFDSKAYGNGILHFHVIGSFLDYEAFLGSTPKEHPLVWTLHDQHLLTGGCYSPGDCQNFKAQCGNCPQLKKPSAHDITHRILATKVKLFQGRNIHLVAPSSWMTDLARTSALGHAARSVRMIHNPLDTNTFSPCDRAEARRLLNIVRPEPVILFGATNTRLKHKGIQHLIPALLQLHKTVPFQIVTFGHNAPDELRQAGIPHTHLGFVGYEHFQRLMYNAADLFALPSLEDNSPQTGTEALACGTPIVAFQTGGIPDFVKHGETGFLAKHGDTDDLALKIKDALSDPDRLLAMRAKARNMAVEKFEAKQQAMAYRAMYEEICQPQPH